MRTRLKATLTATAAAAVAALAAALPAQAVSAPFTWQSHSWCPNLRGTFGSPASCSATQSGVATGDASFSPAQVAINGSGWVTLAMNSTGTTSGAFSTGGQETFSASAAGNVISEQLYLPCSSVGGVPEIDNWPAFWLVTTGSWPAGGEIDVVEGLHGLPAWHYHYLNAAGQAASAGGNITGVGGSFPCGSTGTGGPYTYKVNWTTSKIVFFAGGVEVGAVSQNCGTDTHCQTIDVPVATGPMYVINCYENDNGTESGPLVNGVSEQVRTFTGTKN